MFKLLKYLLFLGAIIGIFQYFTTHQNFSLITFSDLPQLILKKIPAPPVNSLLKTSTGAIVERLHQNDLSDLKTIWKRLGIKSNLFQKGVPYLAESFNLPLNIRGDTLLVFKITSKAEPDWQYLLFKINNRNWNFYGHIDLANQSHTEPLFRTVTIADRVWLVITALAESSDLPEMYQELWYDVTAPKLEEALRYYVYQDLSKPGFIKRYSATVSETGRTAGNYYIDLRFQIAYLNSSITRNGLETAFSISRTIRYLWDHAERQFKSSSHQAVASNNFFTYEADEILKENYLRLKNLAINGDFSQRNLIKSFLKQCSNIPEKKMILRALKG